MATRTLEGEAGASPPANAAAEAKETPRSEAEKSRGDPRLSPPAREPDSVADTTSIKEIELSPRGVEYKPEDIPKQPLWKKGLRILNDRLDICWPCRERRSRLDARASQAMQSTYWLSRIVYLRALGFVYFVAFLISFNQAQGLIGSDGILPAKDYAEKTAKELADATFWEKIQRFPSLFLILPANDFWINVLPFLGCLLSLLVGLKGGTDASTLLVLWVLYQTVFSVGQAWYAFAWEIQLLEIGFLSIFVSPFWCCSRFPEAWPTPLVAVWGSRWLLFRLLLGSGLTKLRSKSDAWRTFSAFDFLYATQPLPNPLSWYLHRETRTLHAVAAVAVLIVECVAGFLVLLPVRSCRLIAACAHLLLQFWWTLGGNYAFLTWSSCLPAILCLDDRFLSCLFPMGTLRKVETLVTLSPSGFSCPLKQAWPLHPQDSERGQAHKGQGAAGGQGRNAPEAQTPEHEKEDEDARLLPRKEQNGTSGETSLPAPSAGAVHEAAHAGERRTCCFWYRPEAERLCNHLWRGAVRLWPLMKRELQQNWTGLLGEAVAATALLISMQQVAQATPAAVWLVVVVFFLAAGLASSSVFITRSRFSHVFVEIVLLVASLQSAINLYINSPAVWSVWIWCCLLTILLIFAYQVLQNAALVFKIQVELLLFLLIAALSIPVVKNLLSPTQIMNASGVDGTLSIVNTYGLFGTVAQSISSTWSNYEFKCKPGDPYTRPCFLSPYHYRLDWLMACDQGYVAQNCINVVWTDGCEGSSLYLNVCPWWIVDADKAETYTLPTEIPGALEHLQEMRELFYRRSVAVRQQQVQQQEIERRRLEKEELDIRRRAAAAKEKKRKAAAAAAATLARASLAAAERRREAIKREQAFGAAKLRDAAAISPPVEEREAGKGRKEQRGVRNIQDQGLWPEYVAGNGQNIGQSVLGPGGPVQLPASSEGAKVGGREQPVLKTGDVKTGFSGTAAPEQLLASPEVRPAGETRGPTGQQQQQQREVPSGAFGTGKSLARTLTDDGGVPLHAAPLLSRRVLKLNRT